MPISLPLDDKGYLDRRCPSLGCSADFKVLFQHCETKVGNAMWCSVCGFKADSTEWNTPEQAKQIERQAIRYFVKEFGTAMARSVRGAKSWTYKPDRPPLMLPFEVAEVMQQEFQCETCACRYAAIGAAFFCPACGHNSAGTMFDLAIQSVRTTIDHLNTIRGALTDAGDRDIAENTTREIVEAQFGKLISSFQRYAEAMFARLSRAAVKVPRNVFQRIDDSNGLWRDACGKGYGDVLSAPEMAELRQLYQQRHLLSHQDGIVDQQYVDRSGDCSYAVGQRLVIRPAPVLRLADLIDRLAAAIRGWVSATGAVGP